jgi:hypothetical protein
MKRKKFNLIAMLLSGATLVSLQAQETSSASGGNATGSGGTASYTVGQMVYTTNTGSNGSVAQGVQQPFEITVVSGIEQAQGISLAVSAYPNPTTNYLILKIDASEALGTQSLQYQLYDISGKLIQSQKVEGIETSISTESLVPATYFLKVSRENKEIKTFKIIKN